MPKSLDERMVEEERNETLYKAVGSLPEIQRRRFLLYYEYEFNFYQIAAMEHCTASAIQKSVAIAKEKVKAEIEEISPTVTDTARKRNLFFICVGLAALHTLTFFRGSKSIFKEVNAYVQRKQRHRPKAKMSEVTETIAEVQIALNRLLRVVELQEKMAKQDKDRQTKAAKKVNELKASGKFVRYKEGAEIYSMSLHKFMDVAKDAGAVYKVNNLCLVNVELLDQYLETFKLLPREY